VDRLFPGFLSADKSGLAPFCQASLDLMAERFTLQRHLPLAPAAEER
jgi:hypothetical protein